MIYSADSANGGVHLIKANNVDLMRLESIGITTDKKIYAAGIFSNTPESSFYVGGGNAFDSIAISNPKVTNGIATGTGDEKISTIRYHFNSIYETTLGKFSFAE